MNKKIICLLLSVLMLLSVVLTSCSEVTDEENMKDIETEASASAVTLVMYLMSEKPVDAEQEMLMEEAVNKITKAKFTTQIDLVYLTPEAYYGELEKNLAKQAENADIYVMEEEEGETTAAETDDYNIELVHYPAVKPNQVDIFYFGGYDKFDQYLTNEYLAMLTENVDGASKALHSYVTPQLMTHMKKVNDGYYAVPTNRAIGEYTYLLLNKDVLAETRYDPEYWEFSSLTCENTQDLLSLVASEASMKDTYVPIYSMTGELDIIDYQYWGIDEHGFLSNDFSLMGGYYDKTLPYGELDSFTPINRVFSDKYFVEQLKVLRDYHQAGYYNDAAVEDENNPKPFAVGYLKGNAADVAKYAEDYEIVTVGTPMIYTRDLYESMFGVSNYSVSLARSMEIITHLNTDETFRNLIQYGVEGINYEVVHTEIEGENGETKTYSQAKVLTGDKYSMDPMKTGNVLLSYPTVNMDPRIYDYAKIQNREVSVSLSMGFQLDFNDYVLHSDRAKAVYEDSKVAFDTIMNTLKNKPQDFTDDFIENVLEPMQNNMEIAFMTAEQVVVDKNTQQELCSLTYIYYEWLVEKGMYIRPEENEDEMM